MQSPEETEKVSVGGTLACFMRVLETELRFTILLHFLCILTCSFDAWACVVGMMTIFLPYLFTFAYTMNEEGDENKRYSLKWKVVLAFKCMNVFVTFNNFMLIFGSDHYFDIKEDIDQYGYASPAYKAAPGIKDEVPERNKLPDGK